MELLTFRITASILCLGLWACMVSAHEWRGIVPMRSTRADVERLLGPPKVNDFLASYYDFPTEFAVVEFQGDSCETECPPVWNVAIGTVISVGVIPKRYSRKNKFLKSDYQVIHRSSGFDYFENEAEGLAVEEYKGAVTLVNYNHARRDRPSFCPSRRDCIVESQTKFDEYAPVITAADEKNRLDNYAIQLQTMLCRGAIIVYGPDRKARSKVLLRAEWAKRYLKSKGWFVDARILVVDGGYREDSGTELRIYSIVGPISRVISLLRQDDPPTKPRQD